VSLAISERDRRVLTIGVVSIGLLLLVGRGIPAWSRWDADARASAAELEAEAVNAEAAVRALPALRDSSAARRQRLAVLAPALVSGESEASAGAALASLVSGAASRAGVQLGAVQLARPDSTARTVFTRVRVSTDATGDLPSLLRFLRALEGGPTMLAVREWSISQPNAGGPADRPEQLRLELSVEGLAAGRATEARP
jgi:hypothetical protein